MVVMSLDCSRCSSFVCRGFTVGPSGSSTLRYGSILSYGDLCILAHYYGVSVEAMTRRLEDLKLLPTGIWDKLKEGGFKVREAQQQLGLGSLPAREQKHPIRYQYLAIDALKDGLLLAAQMNKDEIDKEVQRIIREIGSPNP